jgi:hypothetical protein
MLVQIDTVALRRGQSRGSFKTGRPLPAGVNSQ